MYIDSGNTRGRYVTALTWNLLGAVAAQGSTLIGNVLVARALGVTEFGAFSVVQSTLVTASMVSQLGTGLTVTRFVAEYLERDPQRAMRIAGMVHVVSLVAGLVFAATLLVGADWLAAAALGNPQLAMELRIGSLYVVAAALSGTQLGTLAGLGEYGAIARSSVIAGAAYCAIVGASTWLAGLEGAIAGMALAMLCRVAIQGGFLANHLHARSLRLQFDGFLSEQGVLLKYALPAALSGMSTMPAIWFANASLARSPDGLREMGLLSAALSYRNLVLFLPSVVDSVGAVRLAQRLGAVDNRGFRNAFFTNFAITAALAMGVSAALWLAAGPLLAVFGREFTGANELLGLLLLSAVLQVAASASYQLVNMAGLMWLSLFFIALPRDIGFAVLATWLIPARGLQGVGWAYVASAAFGLVVTLMLAVNVLRRRYPIDGRTHDVT